MPMYEFYCFDCLSVKEYEEIRKKGPTCPSCKTANVERRITSLHVITPKKS